MIKKVLLFLFVISLILVSKNSRAQGSDFQCTPTDLGLLPFAAPCSSSSGFNYSTPVIQTGTTIGAGNDSLSGVMTSCYSGAPLRDVWYSFIASETHVRIDVQGISGAPLQNSYVAIYESFEGECVGLIPRQCDAGIGSGLHTMEFGPLTLGVTYYLQIASTLPTGDGNFTLSVKSKNICSDCSKNSVLNAYPLPVNAAYPPDVTVYFCYTVASYNESFGNLLHGMVPLLGSGWDATTLTPVDAPDSVDFTGQWKWFSGLSIPGSGAVTGFFYDIGGDNDPRNNLGDNGNFFSSWTFCFSVKTQTGASCATLNDLSIRFLNFADGESGSLVTSYDCSGDQDYLLNAHMECCPKPFAVLGQAAGCNNTPDGSIFAYAGFSFFGHEYFLYDENGLLVSTYTSPAGSTAPYTFTGLYQGNYYLYFNENTAGACMTGYNIYVPGPVEYSIEQVVFGCPSATTCSNSAVLAVVSGSLASINWSNGETGYFADSLCTGWNYVTIVDTGSVACVITDSILITNLPFASPMFNYGNSFYCTADSFATLVDFPAASGGTFSLVTTGATAPGITGASLNPSSGIINLTTATGPGEIIVKYSSSPPCSSFYYDTTNVEISPPPPLTSMYPNQMLCVGDIANAYANSSPYDVNWYDNVGSTFLTTASPGSTYDFFGGIPSSIPGNFSFMLLNISTTSTCKSVPLFVNVDVFPIPNVDAGPPLTVCPGFGINLNCMNANSFVWSPAGLLNDPYVVNPVATLSSTTLFTVLGTDGTSGCSATDTVTVFVDENGKCDIVFYNGFTPNADNNNDFWFIDGISIDRENEVTIFNRWGTKVWETHSYDNSNNKWEGTSRVNGKALPSGTYFYVVKFKDTLYKGYVELTR